ncbi:MAG: hypothetical protein M1825_004660 [Sarcosagium campestre]|nr:MAG: hypothetical protein M1825_004660 [Sarcosagium campestre]
MRVDLQSHSRLLLLALLAPLPSHADRCSKLVADDVSFDLHKLGGPKSVWHIDRSEPPSVTNYTFVIDVCENLPVVKDIPRENQCPAGTVICGYDRDLDSEDPRHVVPIAGQYSAHGGGPLDMISERLKSGKSNSDAAKEGLRVEYHGGKYPFGSKKGTKQKAIVEFLCDRSKSDRRRDSLLHFPGDDDDSDDDNDDEGGDEDNPKDSDASNPIKFKSYELSPDGNFKILRLDWHTEYACEDAQKRDKSSSGHWGFFTWFIIILFLGTATYLIFGSWLNYNRYGARGWDLLPHGDTIRDMPYLLKDWSRRVVSTVQGGGSRGGYSAV